jgi:hypothetical protein
MMGTKARPAQLRPHAKVRQWEAGQARRRRRLPASACRPEGGAPGPADRAAILEQALAAAPIRVTTVVARGQM